MSKNSDSKSINTFLKQVKEELKLVTWPTKDEVFKKSKVVIVAMLIIGVYLGILDYIFTYVMSFII